jgi:hypothetical protein
MEVLPSVDTERQAGGCFNCTVVSATAYIWQTGWAKKLRKEAKGECLGGIHSSGCCNNFFLCHECCKAFHAGLKGTKLITLLRHSQCFAGSLIIYVERQNASGVVKLPDQVKCLRCSFIQGDHFSLTVDGPHEPCVQEGVIDESNEYDAEVVHDEDEGESDDPTANHLNGKKHKTQHAPRSSKCQPKTGNNSPAQQEGPCESVVKDKKQVSRSARRRQRKGKGQEILKHRLEEHSKQELSSLDGCLVIYGYHVIIQSWIGKYVTHALGRQAQSNEQGPLHGVIDAATAASIDMKKFHQHDKLTKVKRRDVLLHSLPVDGNCELFREVRVEWLTLGLTGDAVDYSTLRGRHPDVEYILNSRCYTSLHDVLSLVLEPRWAQSDNFLGAQLFLKSDTPVTFQSVNGDEILDGGRDIVGLLASASKKGIEVARSGGSQGQCDPNDHAFKAFLRRKGKAPRVAAACLILVVNSTTKCGFYVMYRSPYKKNLEVVTWWYNTPRSEFSLLS